MKRGLLVLLFLLMLAACMVEIPASPAAVSAIPVSPVPTWTAAPLPNLNGTATALIPEQAITATAFPTPDPLAVAWAGLNLMGKLLYNTTDISQTTLEIHSLDLATGERRIVFHLSERTWTDAVTVSPDYRTLLMAYSAPAGAPYPGQESIYTLPVDGSSPPQLIVTPASKDDQYSQPVWSPDGTYIYFAHINYATMDTYEIMRMAYPDGKPEKFIDHAYWPRVSLDGKYFSFVSLDADSGKNHLYLANIDGSDAHEVPVAGLPVPQIIDVPMVSPDNRMILFSSPDGIKAYKPSWLDYLSGVRVAYADGTLPSDWWLVPIGGGTARPLTKLQSLALYGTYSPDQKWIASYSSAGIFVMKPDGTRLTMIVNDIGGIVGTVNWIP